MSFNNVFGIHEQALKVLSQRSVVLANNLVNADTPNYKAMDIDFKRLLAEGTPLSDMHLDASNPNHISAPNYSATMNVRQKKSKQGSMDGNTVDAEIEKVEFAKNAIQYQANLSFIHDRIKELMLVIRGE